MVGLGGASEAVRAIRAVALEPGTLRAFDLPADGVTAGASGAAVKGIAAALDKCTGLTRSMEQLAQGSVSIEVAYADQQDEIGAMARALRGFRDNAAERQQLERAQAEERLAKERRAGVVDHLVGEFDTAIGSVLGEVSAAGDQMRNSAEQMASVAEQTSNQSTAVVSASDSTARNVQMVAAGTQEVSANINGVSAAASQTGIMATDVLAAVSRLSRQSDALQTEVGRFLTVIRAA